MATRAAEFGPAQGAGATDSGAGGVCNTRLSDTSVTEEAGCDTWRLLFKTGDRLPAHGSKLGQYDVATIPNRALFVLDGHPLEGKLANGRELYAALDEACELVRQEVGRRCTFEGPSRVDSTATQRFAEPADGLAVLAGMAAIADLAPGLKQEVYGRPPETVYLVSKRGRGAKLARAYDAAAMHPELGAVRGETVRFEDQLKLRKGRRPVTQDVVDPAYYRARWRDRFVPLWQASKGVRVVGAGELPRRLVELVGMGAMTRADAERAGGYLTLELGGAVQHAYEDDATRQWRSRRRRLLREHGLVLADDFYAPVDVDLGDVMERVLDSPAWGAYG